MEVSFVQNDVFLLRWHIPALYWSILRILSQMWRDDGWRDEMSKNKRRYAGPPIRSYSVQDRVASIQRNGITMADLKDNFERGVKAGYQKGLEWGYDSAWGSVMLALHREFGFGRDRLARLATGLGVCLDDVAEANIKKLMRRYPHGFTPEDSIRRVDVNEDEKASAGM